MKTSIHIFILSASLVIAGAYGIAQAATPLSFQAGNSARSTFNVDCYANPDAFSQPPISNNLAPNTTYNITGACNGPLYITADGVRLVGADISASIVMPEGHPDVANGTIFADGAHDLRIENLFIDVTAFSTGAAQGTDAAGVYARNAFVRLIDSHIEGGLWSINPFRNAIIRLQGDVTFTNFVNAGISVGDQSLVSARGPVTLSTTVTDNSHVTAVEAYRGGVADFRRGIVVTVPAEDPYAGFFPTAITSSGHSIVRIRDRGVVIVNGRMAASSSASITMQRGTLNGRIDVENSGRLSLSNINQTGVNDGIHLDLNSTASINDSKIGLVGAFLGSVI